MCVWRPNCASFKFVSITHSVQQQPLLAPAAKLIGSGALKELSSPCEILICLSVGNKARLTRRPLSDGELKRGGVHTADWPQCVFRPLYSLSQNTRSWPATSPLRKSATWDCDQRWFARVFYILLISAKHGFRVQNGVLYYSPVFEGV
jgi:hypothetical protein